MWEISDTIFFFNQLHLLEVFLKAIEQNNFKIASAIQKKTIMDQIYFCFFVFQSNKTLRELAELREKSQEWMDNSPLFMNSFHLLNQTIPVLQVGNGSFSSVGVRVFRDFNHLHHGNGQIVTQNPYSIDEISFPPEKESETGQQMCRSHSVSSPLPWSILSLQFRDSLFTG